MFTHGSKVCKSLSRQFILLIQTFYHQEIAERNKTMNQPRQVKQDVIVELVAKLKFEI